MRDLTLDLIQRKWVGGEGKHSVDKKKPAGKMTKLKISPKLNEEEKEGSRPVVLAMKNFNKKAVALNKKKSEKKKIKNPNNTLRIPSDGATGVRVAVSSHGEILSTVKPEFEVRMREERRGGGQGNRAKSGLGMKKRQQLCT